MCGFRKSLEISREKRPGGGDFLVMGYWGCAAGWGCIFTTGLTIMGSTFLGIFNRVTRMGSHFFETLRVKKLFAKK